jgi:hypothetical protein
MKYLEECGCETHACNCYEELKHLERSDLGAPPNYVVNPIPFEEVFGYSSLDEVPDGTFQRYWPNGQMRYEWEYKDGKRADGVSKGWWPNGNLKQTQTWKNNVNEGKVVSWYEDGNKREESFFKNGKMVDKYTTWVPVPGICSHCVSGMMGKGSGTFVGYNYEWTNGFLRIEIENFGRDSERD